MSLVSECRRCNIALGNVVKSSFSIRHQSQKRRYTTKYHKYQSIPEQHLTPISAQTANHILQLCEPDTRPSMMKQRQALMLVSNAELGLASSETLNIVQRLSHCIVQTKGDSEAISNEITNKDISTLSQQIHTIRKENDSYIPEPSPKLTLMDPQNWYPNSRGMKRKIVYHHGPTNSGKTYHALEALKKASNGLYCAPLRLLAWEIHDKLTTDGVPCNLHTGEEIFDFDGAQHTSCTTEMADIDAVYDVAVIDEIQILADSDRGGSWTRALLALQANELHICGDETVKDLVIKLAERCGDELEFRSYDRLCDLRMDKRLTSYADVKKGDCIVGFSRNDLFQIKTEVERSSRHRCSLIYGRLPPANRRRQAMLFNDPNADYDVLIASDAIGMGLNLNIRRVIFSTTKKFDGFRQRKLDISSVLQIAGRAGRYGLHHTGYVTAMDEADYKYIRYVMKRRPPIQYQACLKPEESHIEQIAQEYPWLKFADILRCFVDEKRTTVDSDTYMIPNLNDMIKISAFLENINLSNTDLFVFCSVPIRMSNFQSLAFLQQWAMDVSADRIIHLEMDENLWKNATTTQDLSDIEFMYNILCCYNYLAMRFINFVDYDKCDQLLRKTAQMIQSGFDHVTINNKNEWLRCFGQSYYAGDMER